MLSAKKNTLNLKKLSNVSRETYNRKEHNYMNKVIQCGRLARDPEIKYLKDGGAVAKYTLAVDVPKKDAPANFIPCTAFNKGAEFVEKYLKKGMKIIVVGHLQSGSYDNKEGQKKFTLDVIVQEHEFVEPKRE